MSCMIKKGSGQRLGWMVSGVLGVLAATNAIGAGKAATAGAAPPPLYRVIQLGSGSMTSFPSINSRDQVVFTLTTDDGERAAFYDGASVRDIARPGVSVHAVGLNNAGQVAGYTYDSAGHSRAFVWTQSGGMVDISATGGTSARVAGINGNGRVAGWLEPALAAPRAFRWSARDGMEDLGTLAGGASYAVAINDADLIAGDTDAGDGMSRAFSWTRAGGMVDLGTLGGDLSYSTAVGAKGEVTGYATLARGNPESNRAFLCTPGGKMENLGTAGGTESFPLAMSPGAHIAGVINTRDGNQHGFSWTRATGMVDLGTLGGTLSRALAANDKGQVVGTATTASGDWRGFIWHAAHRMVDLNTRLHRAPKSLVVDAAVAVSDSGTIVATANTGLVLLKPVSPFWVGPASTPGIGPLGGAAMVAAGAPFDATASFTGDDAAHSVGWSWGDGSAAETMTAHASGGAGSASGRHVFRAPGIYTVAVTVADRAGRRATAAREVIVYDPASGVAGGSGWFMSPQGADKHTPQSAGKARFAFRSATGTADTRAQLRFTAGALDLRSTQLRLLSAQGGQARFEGRGTVNGAGDYRFALAAIPGARGAGRFGMKVWHIDPASKREVVDYDNAVAGKAAPALADGMIALQ